MQIGLDYSTQRPLVSGVYCFKLGFTPVSVLANPIAHPNDTGFGPLLYTAGPNITGPFTKDANGTGVECPAGFQDAAGVSSHCGLWIEGAARRLLRSLRLGRGGFALQLTLADFASKIGKATDWIPE